MLYADANESIKRKLITISNNSQAYMRSEIIISAYFAV